MKKKVVLMNDASIKDAVVMKKVTKDKVFTCKVNEAHFNTLKKRGIDIAKTVQGILERMAEFK